MDVTVVLRGRICDKVLLNSQPFPSIRARSNKFYKSFLPYCLKNFM